MTFTLPELRYAYESLSPYVDCDTMVEHHKFHHRAYVTSLNTFVEKTNHQDECLVKLLSETIHDASINEETRKGIRNHGGGHYNHSLFWLTMNERSRTEDICEPLSNMIASTFGSIDDLKTKLSSSALKVFGSGWAWIVYDASSKRLEITTTPNQDTPFSYNKEKLPVLGLDVWEHAYYLQYKHERGKYVERWWNVVDWKNVSYFFEKYTLNNQVVHVKADGSID